MWMFCQTCNRGCPSECLDSHRHLFLCHFPSCQQHRRRFAVVPVAVQVDENGVPPPQFYAPGNYPAPDGMRFAAAPPGNWPPNHPHPSRPMPGHMPGPMPDFMPGPVPGPMPGPVPGPVPGSMPGPWPPYGGPQPGYTPPGFANPHPATAYGPGPRPFPGGPSGPHGMHAPPLSQSIPVPYIDPFAPSPRGPAPRPRPHGHAETNVDDHRSADVGRPPRPRRRTSQSGERAADRSERAQQGYADWMEAYLNNPCRELVSTAPNAGNSDEEDDDEIDEEVYVKDRNHNWVLESARSLRAGNSRRRRREEPESTRDREADARDRLHADERRRRERRPSESRRHRDELPGRERQSRREREQFSDLPIRNSTNSNSSRHHRQPVPPPAPSPPPVFRAESHPSEYQPREEYPPREGEYRPREQQPHRSSRYPPSSSRTANVNVNADTRSSPTAYGPRERRSSESRPDGPYIERHSDYPRHEDRQSTGRRSTSRPPGEHYFPGSSHDNVEGGYRQHRRESRSGPRPPPPPPPPAPSPPPYPPSDYPRSGYPHYGGGYGSNQRY